MLGLSPWVLLALAISTELIATTALKASDGFTRLGFGALVVIGYALSFYFMAISMKQLDLGSTYAIWSGAGTAATAIIGVALFGESFSRMSLAGIALIIAGVVTLQLGGAHG